ncbi:hypothetical protein [Galactobacter caseinivorans]|uniref:Uncharacterized protein n=1 Tax=Galactobacter caseinivorans TaxID=2676123 RepID=A0A496PMH4_9MICC|nr:hypothetical protein [Galactobacter caseinivorans]RKW71741.1 hypothetical protein DWQ67_02630 [Galactobacter caseinivorans]
MPVDPSGMPSQPDDLGALGRRLVQLERLVQLGAGMRSLAKAAIGRGGLRVNKGGNIRIEGGGSLIIETGNLVLGEGQIDGAALASQLEAGYQTATASNLGLTTSWVTKVSLTITAPSWAKTTVVQAYGVGNLAVSTDALTSDQDVNGQVRVQVSGDTSLEVSLTAVNTSTTGTAFRATGAVSYARSVDVSTNKNISVALQARANSAAAMPTTASSRADIYVVVQHYR